MFRRASASVSLNTMTRRSFASTPMRMCYNYEAFNVASVQKPAPQFTAKAVVGGAIKDISLSDFDGKYKVVFFYPLDFTPT